MDVMSLKNDKMEAISVLTIDISLSKIQRESSHLSSRKIYSAINQTKKNSSRHDRHFVAETIEPLARVKAAMNDPSCSLSLRAMLNLYLQTSICKI